MAGTVIRVVPKTFVSFTNIPTATSPTTFWLARKIDVMPWTELTAIIRLHPSTSISASNTWGTVPTIQVYEDGFTDEDPSVFPGFTNLVASAPVGTPVSVATLLAPLVISPIGGVADAGVGCCLAFAVMAKTAAAAVGDIYLSIDLSAKALRGPGMDR